MERVKCSGFVSRGNDVDPAGSARAMGEAHEANQARDPAPESHPTIDGANDEQHDRDNSMGTMQSALAEHGGAS
jgi:hypothetical protein